MAGRKATGLRDAPWVWFFFVAGAAVCGLLVTSEPAAVVLRAVLGRLLPEGRLARVHDLADGWPALLAVLRGRRRYIVSLWLLLWSVHLTPDLDVHGDAFGTDSRS